MTTRTISTSSTRCVVNPAETVKGFSHNVSDAEQNHRNSVTANSTSSSLSSNTSTTQSPPSAASTSIQYSHCHSPHSSNSFLSPSAPSLSNSPAASAISSQPIPSPSASPGTLASGSISALRNSSVFTSLGHSSSHSMLNAAHSVSNSGTNGAPLKAEGIGGTGSGISLHYLSSHLHPHSHTMPHALQSHSQSASSHRHSSAEKHSSARSSLHIQTHRDSPGSHADATALPTMHRNYSDQLHRDSSSSIHLATFPPSLHYSMSSNMLSVIDDAHAGSMSPLPFAFTHPNPFSVQQLKGLQHLQKTTVDQSAAGRSVQEIIQLINSNLAADVLNSQPSVTATIAESAKASSSTDVAAGAATSAAEKPNALREFPVFRSLFRGRRLAVFLDYDGTLTPIVANPSDAILSQAMRRTVDAVSLLPHTAIVTGRKMDTIVDFVGLSHLYFAASHGFDIHGPNGKQLKQVAAQFLPALRHFRDLIREKCKKIPGSLVEDNKFSISVHYRNVVSLANEGTHADTATNGSVSSDDSRSEIVEKIKIELESLIDECLKPGIVAGKLKKNYGKMVFEVKPNFEWNKGYAVKHLLSVMFPGWSEWEAKQGNMSQIHTDTSNQSAAHASVPVAGAGNANGNGAAKSVDHSDANGNGHANAIGKNQLLSVDVRSGHSFEDIVPIYIGDDVTDEDAFKVLQHLPNSISIFVKGSTGYRPTAAKYVVDGVEEVKEFLAMVADATSPSLSPSTAQQRRLQRQQWKPRHPNHSQHLHSRSYDDHHQQQQPSCLHETEKEHDRVQEPHGQLHEQTSAASATSDGTV